MKRKQFTFYESFYKAIENLPTKKEKLQAYEIICDYALYGKLPEPEDAKPSVLAVFSLCQPVFDTARKRAAKCTTENNLSPPE